MLYSLSLFIDFDETRASNSNDNNNNHNHNNHNNNYRTTSIGHRTFSHQCPPKYPGTVMPTTHFGSSSRLRWRMADTGACSGYTKTFMIYRSTSSKSSRLKPAMSRAASVHCRTCQDPSRTSQTRSATVDARIWMNIFEICSSWA